MACSSHPWMISMLLSNELKSLRVDWLLLRKLMEILKRNSKKLNNLILELTKIKSIDFKMNSRD
jgi:hypothetical protein